MICATTKVEGIHPQAAQTTTSIPRPLCPWQLPLWIWLERYGAPVHWPPVISARSRVFRFISQGAHSLLYLRAALSRFHQAPALLPPFCNAGQDRYLSPVLIDSIQPITVPNVLSDGLARDKRRQKYAGLRLRRPSRKGAFSGRTRSHFTLVRTPSCTPSGNAREPGEVAPYSRALPLAVARSSPSNPQPAACNG